jgi:hypothetical protein
MEKPKTEVVKLKIFDLELRPLTIIIGKTVEKSLLLSQLASATTDAIFLPSGRACVEAFNMPVRLMRSTELLLRDIGIELYVSSAVYVKTSSGKRLELAHAPPSIREIIMVIFAISSKDFRFVFIEEPEAHLHPSAQRILARAVAEAVNNGKFVVLTTNSDYLLGELNNLIALSNAPEGVRKKLGYRDVEVLRPEAVAAYLVKAEGNRAVVERLEVDYTGIPEDEFARVAEEILRVRNEIY